MNERKSCLSKDNNQMVQGAVWVMMIHISHGLNLQLHIQHLITWLSDPNMISQLYYFHHRLHSLL